MELKNQVKIALIFNVLNVGRTSIIIYSDFLKESFNIIILVRNSEYPSSMHPSVYLFVIGELGHWTIKEECLDENVPLAAKEGNDKLMIFFIILA